MTFIVAVVSFDSQIVLWNNFISSNWTNEFNKKFWKYSNYGKTSYEPLQRKWKISSPIRQLPSPVGEALIEWEDLTKVVWKLSLNRYPN